MASQDALRYREKVEQLTAEALEAPDQRTRDTLLEIARQYDKLAEWAERQEKPDP
jgi:hypothetical protein